VLWLPSSMRGRMWVWKSVIFFCADWASVTEFILLSVLVMVPVSSVISGTGRCGCVIDKAQYPDIRELQLADCLIQVLPLDIIMPDNHDDAAQQLADDQRVRHDRHGRQIHDDIFISALQRFHEFPHSVGAQKFRGIGRHIARQQNIELLFLADRTDGLIHTAGHSRQIIGQTRPTAQR